MRRPPLAYYSGNCVYANLTQAGVSQPFITGQSARPGRHHRL